MKKSQVQTFWGIQKGFNQFLETLTGGRITIAALALGISQGCI